MEYHSSNSPLLNGEDWERIIKPKTTWFDFHLKALWSYRDLVLLFVRRDFASIYKQTILGPLWFFLQPLLTSFIFTIIFGFFGNLSSDGTPSLLFYLSGLCIWNYFSESLVKTSEVFIQNQQMFGKVYFPRLAVPVSIILSNLLKFLIQFALFVLIYAYFLFNGQVQSGPVEALILVPVIIIFTALLSLSFGILFSALTTKYRDLRFLLQFAVQLMMYASSVVIPLSVVPEKYQWIVKLNPLVPMIEVFRYAFLGQGSYIIGDLIYSFAFTLFLLALAIPVFNKVEKSFIDTI